MKVRKRLLSLFLAFALALGMTPILAFADDSSYPVTVTVGDQEMTNVVVSELEWIDWMGMPLPVTCYTVAVPADATEATIEFEEDMQWTYYTSAGEYVGEGETSWSAQTTHVVAIQDYNDDGELDGISVQDPATFSTAFYILFVREASQEKPCLEVLENAPATGSVPAGGLYKLNLKSVFGDSKDHDAEYEYSISPAVENEHTKISGNEFCFTSQSLGDYQVTLSAKCSDGKKAERVVTVTVKEPSEGIPAQYGYDETDKSSVTVYVTVSNDGMPLIADGVVLSHLEVTVPYFDLGLYGLQSYYRYGTNGGKGVYTNKTVVQRPTGLHLYIYLLERYYLGLPEEQCCLGTSGVLQYASSQDILYMSGALAYKSNGKMALKTSGGATSIYMNNFWGHDENLMYFRNHCYPFMNPGWGSTSDYILLSDGDSWDVGMFSDWNFNNYGSFASFDQDVYSVEQGGIPLTVKTRQWGTSESAEDFVPLLGNAGMIVGLYDEGWDLVQELSYNGASSDSITFAVPEQDGLYYLMAMDPNACTDKAKTAPATARVLVGDAQDSGDGSDVAVTRILLDDYDRSMWVGDSFQLNATVVPAEATGYAVEWASSDASVAAVDQNGKVVAVGEGTAVITASVGEVKATCTVSAEKYNSAPTVVSDAATWMKIHTNETHMLNVAALFSDAQNDELSYAVTLCEATALNRDYSYMYSDLQNLAVTDGVCQVSLAEEGVYALKITASDGNLSTTHICQVTVVGNDSGVIELADGVALSVYNVVVVGSSREFAEGLDMGAGKGVHDATIHHIVLSKDTVSGTPPAKMQFITEGGSSWGQRSNASGGEDHWQTRASIGIFAKDSSGEITAHYLQFHTECAVHADADKNCVCDNCTLQLPAAGKFAFMVVNESDYVVEPCYVSYAEGASIKDALKNSGHVFTGIDSGYISAIDGKADNYSIYYDGGGFDLNAAASSITGLWITANAGQTYSDDLMNLFVQMSKYRTSTDGVKNYSAAQDAYAAAAGAFYDTSNAQRLYFDLKNAMDRFAAFYGGEKATVAMNITLGDAPVTSGKAVFESEFGTKVETSDLQGVLLVPGTYSFDISDGGFRHVRGAIVVEGDTVLTAALPTGLWMASVEIGTASGAANWKAVDKANVTESSATYYVPDYAATSLYPYVTRGEGVDKATHKLYLVGSTASRTWESVSTALAHVIEPDSLQNASIVMECRFADSESGYEQYQTYTIDAVRAPSLKELSVFGDGTQLKLDFDKATFAYAVTTASDILEVVPATLVSETALTVAGQTATSGESFNVVLANCEKNADGAYLVPVTVSAPNGQTRAYSIQVTKVDAIAVTLVAENGVSVRVVNDAGAVVQPVTRTVDQLTYKLIAGQEYTYVSTVDEYYHATATFKPQANGDTFTAATPKKQDWLSGMSAKSATSKTAVVFDLAPAFSASTHAYSTLVESNNSGFYLSAYSVDASKYTTEAIYLTHNNSAYSDFSDGRAENVKTPGASASKFTSMANFVGIGGWSNEMTVRVTQKTAESGVTYYQDYLIAANRTMTLYGMTVADDNGNKLQMTQSGTETTGYAKLVYGYSTKVGSAAEEASITLQVSNSASNIYDADQYMVTVSTGEWSEELAFADKNELKATHTVTVPLSGTVDTEVVSVTVSHKGTGAVAQAYTVEFVKLPPVATTIAVDPADATVFLTEDTSGGRVLPEADGTYVLNTGASYTYVASKVGYVAQTGSFVAGGDNETIAVELEEAPDTDLRDIAQAGDWLQFRADDNNNGVVDVKTPVKSEDTVLVWSNKVGEGYGSGATGCPIIAGGYLYTYAGKSIVKVNKDTGEVVASGAMTASSSFAINSPTYAEGMIFVGLSGGKVQAFNAETLESLWVFTATLGGQPNCPIVYSDGYIYTGFWSSETKKTDFVCVSVTDEDPTKTDETKLATWSYTHNGFYWAGAYACEDYVLVGTDDGEAGYETGYASILSFDPKTGELLDEWRLTNVGDQRSSICYDEVTDAYYFTTKGGDFYQVKVNEDGTFVDNSLRRLHLENGTNNADYPPMSTSTPVVHNGRAYIGVSGMGQFSNYSGHNMTVIDLATFSIAYTVPTMGYPQTSGLLTTAYEDIDGYAYVYFIDNASPGVLRVLRDKPGMTEVDHSYTTVETYTVNGVETTVEAGYVLFTPYANEAQYAICSPITDEEGNLYFKNDSARMMRLSSRITSLEVVQQPEALVYEAGMTFDGAGLAVVAHYANGLSEDITDYLSYTTDPLTADDTEITVSFDPDKQFELADTAEGGFWEWYQDAEGLAGQTYYLPTATVNVTIVGHSMIAVEAQAPTCTKDGVVAHYFCDQCEKAYADAEGIQVLESVVDPAAGHDMTAVDGQPATCTENGIIAHFFCSACQTPYADEAGTVVLSAIVDIAQGHEMGEYVAVKEPTAAEKGWEESICANCGHIDGRDIPMKEAPAQGGSNDDSSSSTASSTGDGVPVVALVLTALLAALLLAVMVRAKKVYER